MLIGTVNGIGVSAPPAIRFIQEMLVADSIMALLKCRSNNTSVGG